MKADTFILIAALAVAGGLVYAATRRVQQQQTKAATFFGGDPAAVFTAGQADSYAAVAREFDRQSAQEQFRLMERGS